MSEQNQQFYVFPASYAQQSQWFFHEMAPDSPLYHLPYLIRMQGALDRDVLEKSLQAVVDRHESLRTSFRMERNQPVQAIAPERPVSLPVSRLDPSSDIDQESRIQAWAMAESGRWFDLQNGPLLRGHLLEVSEDEHFLIMTMHHSITDGWSMAVFIKEWLAFYRHFVEDQPIGIAEPSLQYADFSEWQRERYESGEWAGQLAYWKRQLQGSPAILQLPTDKPRPPVQSYQGASYSFSIGRELTEAVSSFSRDEGITLFMTLFAAYQTLLYRYSGQDDLVAGTPIAGRNQAGMEDLIGFVANTLALRCQIGECWSFRRLADHIRHVTLDAYDHQDVPFDKVVDELRIERNAAHSPLFQVMFVLQNTPVTTWELPGITCTPVSLHNRTAKFDLTLTIAEEANGLACSFEYNTDLYREETIRRMAGHFERLLQHGTEAPDQPLTRLPMATVEEIAQEAAKMQQYKRNFDTEQTIHRLFEIQAARTPHAVAVVFEEKPYTYQELNERANQLAHELVQRGISADSLVGICMERSLDLIVAIVGILKAGGAYVPLDPRIPSDRLQFILEDSRVKVLLTQSEVSQGLPPLSVTRIHLDTDWENISRQSKRNPELPASARQFAYVIYTSGTTGKPKGVLVDHGNVTRLFAATEAWYGFTNRDVWTLYHSYAFDFSVWEIWGALFYGGKLVIVPFWISRSPEDFYQLLQREQVTVLNQTPSAFRQLIALAKTDPSGPKLTSLRYVIFGGEALDLQGLRPWFERYGDQTPQLVNMYGITETTVHVTYRPITSADLEAGKGNGIGIPIPDLQVYVLDRHLQPVPKGVIGEMYVGGAGVTPGYLRRPELTAERFIVNEAGERLYKTGDLARYLQDGELEYHGRMDHQVKIRGFRIELGEIESALVQYPGIREAVAAVKEDQQVGNRIVAYAVWEQAGSSERTDGLRRYLQERLPDYMIPAAFVEVSAIPLNHNGKVDYAALPAPDFTAVPRNYVAPRTDIEKKLASIWEQVLQVQPIGVEDNFFEAGGDSILSIRILGEVRKLGYKLTVQDLFRFQTVSELAHVIGNSISMEDPLPVTAPFQLITEEDRTRLPSGVIDAYPLTKLQEGMLFHSSYQQDARTYLNVSSYRLKAPFHLQAWEQAIAGLMNDHPVLRTSFDLTGYTQPLQLVHEEVELPFEVIDLRHLSSPQQEQWLADWKDKKETASFDWTKAPLFKIVIHLRSEETFQFTCIEHHAILDGWSVASLFAEVFRLYVAFMNRKEKNGQAPQAEFRDYVAMEGEALRSEEHQRFWKEQVSSNPFHEIPRWHKAKTEQRHQIREMGVEIPPVVSDSVKQLANRMKVPLKSILLAAHFRVLQMASGQSEVISGVPFNGRTEGHDGERTLGLFLNALPFGVTLSGGTWTDLIHRVFEQEQSYLRYRRYPLAQIQQDSGGNPLYEVIFNFTHFHVLDSLRDLDDFQVLDFSERTYNNFAMSIEFGLDQSDRLQLLIQWDQTRFCEEQMALMSGYYRKALEFMIQDPMACYEDQDLLTEAERNRIVTRFNPPEPEDESAVLRSKTIHRWFEEQAAETPDQIAVVYEGKQLTYRELNEEANRMAHRLRVKGVVRESIVGIMAERSIEMAVGTLAILKAGGTYLPIDPEYPAERIEYVLQDSRASLLLTKQEWIGRFHYTGEVIDLCRPSNEANDRHNLPDVNDPSDLAYIIYTSGSTGKPKGVMVEHRNVIRLVIRQDFIDFVPGYRLLMTGNFAFDISTLEIWGPLLNGLTLYLISKEKLLDPEKIERELADNQIDIVHLVSPLFSQLSQGNPEMFSTVRTLLVGGDVVSASHVNLVRKHCPKLKVIHSYGPTENTTFSTTYQVNRDFDSALPIGKPLRRSTAYVVDPKTEFLRPVGVPGELWVGGEGVARGYFNQPEMTKEKFIESPFQAGEKIYKTGDQARWLADGTLEFLGRIDQQVKIRGYRVELSEIEYCLLQLEKVKEAVVIARGDQHDKVLCAYVIGSEPLSVSELREHAAESLPDFMIPSYFMQLEQIPLTAHGKVDRKQLPEPQAGGYLEQEWIAPRNEWETKLADVWQEVLGLERISVRESFFTLGGHSLKATILVSKLRKALQAEIEIKDIFTHQTVERLAQFVMQAEVRQHRSIPAVEPQAYYPASSAQRRMFTLDKIVENKRLYNIPIAVRIRGSLDRKRFQGSWQTLVERHESLRTGFELVEGEVVQKVHPPVPFTVDFIPVSNETEEAWLQQLVNKPFGLNQAPLFQATVLERTNTDFILVMNMHHSISDEASIGVILRELMAIYEGRALSEQKIQYKDYASWHNQLLQTEIMKQQETYWVNQFRDEVPVLQLPTDFRRPAVIQYDGDSVSFAADSSVMTGLRKLTQYTGTTNYMVLLAAFNVLLAKYSRQFDVIVGTPIAGRTHADVENVVGMFVNTLAIRTNPRSDKTFLQYVREVKAKALEAYRHQDYPFDYLVDQLKVKRDPGRNPLFDVLFSMEYPDIPQSGNDEIRFEPYETPYPFAKFDLSLYAQEIDGQLRFTFQYATGLFTKETMERMAVHYGRILQSILARPEKSLASIQMITETEKQQILFDLNETEAATPADRTIHRLFEEQVRSTPNQIAVVHREVSLTYLQVNERANQLAWRLRHEGVAANTIVGLMVERSVEAVVGILGILKAGGAYVPVDPELPPERVRYLLDNSGAQVLITQSSLPDQADYKGKTIDIHDPTLAKQPTTNPESGNQPDDLMYVIYTSGSTGNPKGVMIEHRSMVNYVAWFTETAKLTADDRTILLSSYAFDLGYTSLYSSLLNGCVLHIADKDLVRIPEALLAYLGDHQISFIKGTPSLFRMMLHASSEHWRKACEALRLVVLGGESMNAEEVRGFLQTYPHVQVMNHYGPTEACVGAIAGFVDPEQLADRMNVPVGTPIHNNKVYILDPEFQAVPAGVPGELFISGAGLARGYLHRPELTEERFLTNPFADGERIYRTGDIVRLRPDRRVEFLGRADHQVKIRGYRVELEEIESHLLLHPSILQAAVICKDGQSLMAYIVTAEELTLTALRDYLAEKVPDYMIPAQFAVLDRIPLTHNGKVDRRALPEAEGIALEARHTSPLDHIEQDLVQIWEQVLGIKGVGTHDNFFDIGGNSMSLIRMHSLIEPKYAGVTVIHLFSYPSISKLAAYIRQTVYQDQKPNLQAIPYPEEYFAAGKGLKGTLNFTIEGEWLASIQDATESMQLNPSEFMLALFLYLQAELTGQEQITIPAITGWNDKIHFVTIDLRRMEKLSDLFQVVQDQVKEAASPNDPFLDPAFMKIVKDEQAMIPGFMRRSASASETRFAEMCDLLLVLHEHPARLYVECMYNARLNKAKIMEMMRQYVQIVQSLAEQLEPSKG